MGVYKMGILIAFTEVIAEQPEWLDKLLLLWGEASGWIQAMVALLGTGVVTGFAVFIKNILKNRKLTKMLSATFDTLNEVEQKVANLCSGVESLIKGISVLDENINKDLEKMLLKIESMKKDQDKSLDTMALIAGMVPTPTGIKKELLLLVKDNEAKEILEKKIDSEEQTTLTKDIDELLENI